jgi:pimeloyl-ACP methyl ester carboxylesterase
VEGLEEYVPRLTLQKVRDASHWIIHEKPELVMASLEAFLE